MHSRNPPPPIETRSLTIVYASVTGSSIDVAERIARRGRREGWHVSIHGAAEFKPAALLTSPLIVFVLATTGNGVAPPTFTPLWTSLLHPSLPCDLLEDLRFAVFGLGDSSYPKYNWVGRKMSRRLEGLGAIPVVERGEGDDQNEWGIESTFPGWLDGFFEAIDPLCAPPPGCKKLTPDDLLPPRVRLEALAVDEDRSRGRQQSNAATPPWASDVRWAKVRKIDRVTDPGWFQDVRSLQLEIEGGAEYLAGDVLEIRPQNSNKEVKAFLASAGWTSVADQLFAVHPTSPDQALPPHLPSPYITSLRHLLTHELDIGGVPRVSFFEWLAAFTEGDIKEKLLWFCQGVGQDDLIDYTLRPRRTIAEVMYEFRSAKVPPEYVFDLLPPMRARGFSIASSTAGSGTVDLLVAIVAYRTTLSEPRKGICTSYIASLAPGDRIPIRFESGALKLPLGKAPLIMVGPGTGVAPFRALMQERIRVGATENLLFFGCRSVKADYFYREEWEKMVLDGQLTMSVAASRDQEDKIYVQHRIPEYAAIIKDYISRGGFLYICGSSTAMPKAVKKAFLSILEEDGAPGSGEKAWDEMEKSGRIIEETWG